MKQKIKLSLIIPLLFFLSSLIFLLFIPFSRADTASYYLTHQQNLTPYETEWQHYGRDVIIDFQEYYEGSNINFTASGATGTISKFGIFSMNNEYLDSRINVTNELINLTYAEPTDKILLLDSSSIGVIARNNISICDFSQTFTYIETTFMATFIILPTYSPSGTNVNFGLTINDIDVMWFHMVPNFHGGLGIMQGQMEYWNGAGWTLMYYMNFSTYDDGVTSFYYSTEMIYIYYQVNQQGGIAFYNITSKTEMEVDYGCYITPTSTVSGSVIYDAELFFRQTSLDDQPLLIRFIDSSQLRSAFHLSNMVTFAWKTVITRGINEIFNFMIPQGTMYQENVAITNITIASDKNYSSVINLVIDISGNTEHVMNISNLDSSYQQIPSTIYYQNITFLQINTRYRTLDLEPFNNTIRLNVTLSYTPASITFPILILNSVIPIVILLIVPSAVAYTAFKKTGFLAMFFVMTLILTVTNYIPFAIGVLIMGVLITIFLKSMKSNDTDEEE